MLEKKHWFRVWLVNRFPVLRKIKGIYVGLNERNKLNVLSTFPMYAPNSAGEYKDKSVITLQTINRVFPCLSHLAQSIHGNNFCVSDIASFPKTGSEKNSAVKLESLFNLHGSDKANHHYHYLYGSILQKPEEITSILEIGLGTNNIDVVSNMGPKGQPGASLRAFRDYCTKARIYGADVDKRILFSDDRIETFYVDQTITRTFLDLHSRIAQPLDMVIDDGLHSPDTNIETLRFGLEIVKPGGWVIIEDIAEEALSIWQTVAALLPENHFQVHILKSKGPIVFAVKRLQ